MKYRLEALGPLLDLLQTMTFQVIGPVVRNNAIVYDTISTVDDFPQGYTDEQAGGHYRLKRTEDCSYFSYVVGPDSWKRYLFSREEVLYSTTEDDGELIFKTSRHNPVKRAFFGIRSCELHAIGVQDRVFIESDFADPHYAQRRSDLIFIAVNCTRSADTCFCTSLDTGPKAKSGFDLSITEVLDNGHYFILESGSDIGDEIVRELALNPASDEQVSLSQRAIENAAQQKRKLNVSGIKETIYKNLEHQQFWEDIADRCLNCANCTMVCPTCFCSTVEDRTDLAGSVNERVRQWDSCFNLSHSHIAGGSVRVSSESRYRQWFSHKLASWQDQFDTLGCTGCGRCITWCPVGIDITEEAARLQVLDASTVENT